MPVAPGTLAGRLIRIQSFKEVAWGTSAAATARWMAITPTPTFTPIYKSTVVDEDRGSLAPGYLAYQSELGGAFSVNWEATFEDINFSLYGIMGAATITGGPNYLYTYAAPLTAAWSPQTYTLEYAYDLATILAKGCLTTKLSIKGNAKKNWTISQSGFYKTNDPNGSLTALLVDRTVEPILFAGETTLAIDAAGAVVGTTAITSALVSFQLDIENQVTPFFTGDSKAPTDFAEDKFKATLTLKLKYNAVIKALYQVMVTNAAYLFQIKATSGAKVAEIDFSGILYSDPQNYAIDYGAITIELKFDAIYDTTLANYLKVLITNGVSALP